MENWKVMSNSQKMSKIKSGMKSGGYPEGHQVCTNVGWSREQERKLRKHKRYEMWFY